MPFVHLTHAARVVFGVGTLDRLSAEVELAGLERLLVLTTPGQAALGVRVGDILGSRVAAIHPHAAMHTPVDATLAAVARAQSLSVDGLLAIGGGSTIGLGKAIARRLHLPQIAVPTTYAGSEMTPISGETENGLKTTMSDDRLRPAMVLYDVDLTIGLPASIAAVSGLNAIAHAVEALYARDANPVTALFAREGIAKMAGALRVIARAPGDVAARSDALYASWLCGMCLGSVGMALHHKLCHTLGGSFGLPHAPTHAAVLPHAMAYNAPAAPQADRAIAEALGSRSAAQGLFDLAADIGAPTALRDIGMAEQDIEPAIEIALANPYWNPRPIERAPLRALLRNAWSGQRPEIMS
ncbi:maleylacetate reductase [Sphingobium sp.]|uniref:maleylacetate reductase n=1 Tax=Sphingobium sp. TaxID=1912891 RepID=UPI003BB73EF0